MNQLRSCFYLITVVTVLTARYQDVSTACLRGRGMVSSTLIIFAAPPSPPSQPSEIHLEIPQLTTYVRKNVCPLSKNIQLVASYSSHQSVSQCGRVDPQTAPDRALRFARYAEGNQCRKYRITSHHTIPIYTYTVHA